MKQLQLFTFVFVAVCSLSKASAASFIAVTEEGKNIIDQSHINKSESDFVMMIHQEREMAYYGCRIKLENYIRAEKQKAIAKSFKKIKQCNQRNKLLGKSKTCYHSPQFRQHLLNILRGSRCIEVKSLKEISCQVVTQVNNQRKTYRAIGPNSCSNARKRCLVESSKTGCKILI